MVRLYVAMGLIALFSTVLLPAQYISLKFNHSLSSSIPKYWHRWVLRLLGVKVKLHGKFAQQKPLLIIANHVSWADILILGSLTELSFISKAEVGEWPLIKHLATWQRTVFVNRTKRSETAKQASEIAARLAAGDRMVLFAEGTTGCGNLLKPFNSSLFGAAQMAIRQTDLETVTIQPLALAYTRLHAMPLGRNFRPLASWPGDVGLAPHLKRFLSLSSFDIDVVLGEPIQFDAGDNRKHITKQAETEVRNCYGTALGGRIRAD